MSSPALQGLSVLTPAEIDAIKRDDPTSLSVKVRNDFTSNDEFSTYQRQVWTLMLKHHAIKIYSVLSQSSKGWWITDRIVDARNRGSYHEVRFYLDSVIAFHGNTWMHEVVGYRYLLTKGYDFTKMYIRNSECKSLCLLLSIGGSLQLSPGWVGTNYEEYNTMMLYDSIHYRFLAGHDDVLLSLTSDQDFLPVLKRIVADQRYDIIDRDKLFGVVISGNYPEALNILKSLHFTPSDEAISRVRELIQ
jgi:hypothetical protein